MESESLTYRSVKSVTFQSISSLGRILISFIRTTILARLLPIEVFGVYAFAKSVVILTGEFANFGFGDAFLYQNEETQNEETAADIHFTIKLIFSSAWICILLVVVHIFSPRDYKTALLVLSGVFYLVFLSETPQIILTRRVEHRRLAVLELLTSILITVVALFLAFRGATLWALLSMDISRAILWVFGLYIWKPVWIPKLRWVKSTIKYYLNFGWINFIAHVLLQSLDRIDDLWTNIWLGTQQLGFYSRAYTFATYPRRVLSKSIELVSIGTFSELKDNRENLSRAFYISNAFLIRVGFCIAGALSLVAPEFIRLVLGDKWLPMLNAFQLMIVFTLLDPIKVTIANLFVAVGQPNKVVKARAIQLGVMIIGLFALGPILDISGVALTMDIMLVVGISILFHWAKRIVDFSIKTLFLIPILGVIIGLFISNIIYLSFIQESNDIIALITKLTLFISVFTGVLYSFENKLLRDLFLLLRNVFKK